MRPIWKRSDVDPARQYVLLLIRGPSGRREFELRELARKDEPVLDGERIFMTQVIPDFDPVLRRDIMEIARRVRLSNGQRFDFDSNGHWYTEDELADWGIQPGRLARLVTRVKVLARRLRLRRRQRS